MTTKGFSVPCATSRTYQKRKGASGSRTREQLVYMGDEKYVYKPAFDSFTLSGRRHHTPAVIRRRPVYRRIVHSVVR